MTQHQFVPHTFTLTGCQYDFRVTICNLTMTNECGKALGTRHGRAYISDDSAATWFVRLDDVYYQLGANVWTRQYIKLEAIIYPDGKVSDPKGILLPA